MGKAPNHMLWHEEVKLGMINRNAFAYAPKFSQVESGVRGGKNAMGLGKKSNAVVINTCPGPQDY